MNIVNCWLRGVQCATTSVRQLFIVHFTCQHETEGQKIAINYGLFWGCIKLMVFILSTLTDISTPLRLYAAELVSYKGKHPIVACIPHAMLISLNAINIPFLPQSVFYFTAKPRVNIGHVPDLWCVGRVSGEPHTCLFGKLIMGMTKPLVQGWSTEELLFSFDWVYNNMLSTYIPFIKLSVVHSPLNYNVRAVAEQHSCVMVQLMLMKYGNIIKCIIVHCIAWWELLKKGCDMLSCMERGVGGWH